MRKNFLEFLHPWRTILVDNTKDLSQSFQIKESQGPVRRRTKVGKEPGDIRP